LLRLAEVIIKRLCLPLIQCRTATLQRLHQPARPRPNRQGFPCWLLRQHAAMPWCCLLAIFRASFCYDIWRRGAGLGRPLALGPALLLLLRLLLACRCCIFAS
jgi:hypothetical protein